MRTKIVWADAQVTEIRADYDEVVISLQDSFGHVRHVRAEGYIRLELDGVWDDVLVATGEYRDHDATAQAAWASVRTRYAEHPPEPGSPARRSTTLWRTLTITLIDGAVLRCVAARFIEE